MSDEAARHIGGLWAARELVERLEGAPGFRDTLLARAYASSADRRGFGRNASSARPSHAP